MSVCSVRGDGMPRDRAEGVHDVLATAETALGERGSWPWYRRSGRAPASHVVSRSSPMSRVTRSAVAVDYPYSDGRPMAESEAQLRAMVYVLTMLYMHFKNRSDVYVGGDMFVYYEEGNPGAVVAPDVFVAIGAPKQEKKPRLSYKLWEEPKGPDFVLEVVSRSTWAVDRNEKPKVYARLGVEEYWLYDPTGEHDGPRLRGMRLVGGGYRDLPPVASGFGVRKLRSAVLGLDLGDGPGRCGMSLRSGDRKGASEPCNGTRRPGGGGDQREAGGRRPRGRRGADCGASGAAAGVAGRAHSARGWEVTNPFAGGISFRVRSAARLRPARPAAHPHAGGRTPSDPAPSPATVEPAPGTPPSRGGSARENGSRSAD